MEEMPAVTASGLAWMTSSRASCWALWLRSRGGLWLVAINPRDRAVPERAVAAVLHGEDYGGQVGLGGVGGAVAFEGFLDLVAAAHGTDGGVAGVGHGCHWAMRIIPRLWPGCCNHTTGCAARNRKLTLNRILVDGATRAGVQRRADIKSGAGARIALQETARPAVKARTHDRSPASTGQCYGSCWCRLGSTLLPPARIGEMKRQRLHRLTPRRTIHSKPVQRQGCGTVTAAGTVAWSSPRGILCGVAGKTIARIGECHRDAVERGNRGQR